MLITCFIWLINTDLCLTETEQEYNNVIKWADIYENADLPTKQIIVAHLIDSISVKKGYKLTVNFKINLEQFENGLEFQA